jgi:hypothetical protein
MMQKLETKTVAWGTQPDRRLLEASRVTPTSTGRERGERR